MKNRKGFTLIELLAVIVILAVLMVIAVPKILNVIESSRGSAASSSIKLVKKGIKTNVSAADLLETNPYTKTEGCYVFDFDTPNANVTALTIDNKDKVGGSIKLCDGKFSDDTLTFDGSTGSSSSGGSSTPVITENPDYVIEEANALIITVSGREFRKVTADKAYVAYFIMNDYSLPTHTCPLLVSENADAVKYTALGVTFSSIDTIEYNGKTYYISDYQYSIQGINTPSAGFAQSLGSTAMTHKQAAELLLDTVFN